jgi:glycosyltransferase involved in cell wall biosynthesis
MQSAKAALSPRATASVHRTAVLIPCFNEAHTIGKVVAEFRAALPDAVIYVYDNNSTDGTAEAARAAGAVVGRESRQGKGHVVRRMFREIDADIFVLVDGDATYDAASAPALIAELVDGGADMVVGARISQEAAAYRLGHQFGNRTLTGFVATVFGKDLRDMLSGYRVMSRRFVKSFPALSSGFEFEAEITIHALELELAIAEVETPYYSRPAGSLSKLNTWRDGVRILLTILRLYRSERPLAFFSIVGVLLAAISVVLAVPVFVTYLETGLVPRLPTAILSTGLMILAFLSAAIGLVLDTVSRGRREMKLLAYLAQAPLVRRAGPPAGQQD